MTIETSQVNIAMRRPVLIRADLSFFVKIYTAIGSLFSLKSSQRQA